MGWMCRADEEDRRTVHRVIYDELVQGRVKEKSRAAYRDIIARLVARGAKAIILGCTEIMLLVRPEDSSVPLFDTTAFMPMPRSSARWPMARLLSDGVLLAFRHLRQRAKPATPGAAEQDQRDDGQDDDVPEAQCVVHGRIALP